MGCFPISQQHKRKHNVPSPSPSSSSSSLTLPPSIKHLLELKRDGCLPHPPLHHASACGMCSPSWSFRSKVALLHNASSKLAKDHPRALTGSFPLRNSTERSHERSHRSSMLYSAPMFPGVASEECASSHLFPLPAPPMTDDGTSSSSSPTSPTLSSNAGLSASSSTISPTTSNNVGDTAKERSSTSSSSSSGSSSITGMPTSTSKLVSMPALAPAPAPTSSSTATSGSSLTSTLVPASLSPMSSLPSLQSSISSPSSFLSTTMGCPLPLPPPSALSGFKNLREYTYDELAGACQNFAPQFFIRDGGSGPVFRAIVKDEHDHTVEVAVTCLTHAHMQSYKRWRAEVGSLARLSHPHLCKVVGFCAEDPASSLRMSVKAGAHERERYLVYEHTANGCLERLLYGRLDKAPLDWVSRLRIAMGAAQGLAYLHDRIPRQVIYKSFKALNIQVDKEFNAKLSDYGFTRCSKDIPSTSPACILAMDDAYEAPETRAACVLSPKSNVWSFGVVLLELLTGRQNMDELFPAEERDLIQWTRPYLLDPKRLYLVVDPELKGRYSTRTAKLLADLALQCLSEDPVARPSMRQVAAMLSSVAPCFRRGSGNAKSNSNYASGYANPAKWKSKSYNLASILASPARSFNSSSQQQQQQQQQESQQPSRMRFMGFLSGELPKEVSRSISDHQAVYGNSRMWHSGFLSGEILQGSLPSDSPMPTNGYFPPPLGRSLATGATTMSG